MSGSQRRTMPIGRPSVSAAICGKTVRVPCPMSVEPEKKVTTPSARARLGRDLEFELTVAGRTLP